METRLKIIMVVTIVLAFLLIPIMFYSALASPVPDTGQTKCYDDVGNEINPCPSPGEDFYGQDGQYINNPHSYTKLDANGNDLPDEATEWVMVRDNVTGLIWEMKDSKDGTQNYDNPHDADNAYTWYDGITGIPGDGTDTLDFITAINDANLGGHNDWRLPTIKELSFLRKMDIQISGIPVIDTDYFPNTGTFVYAYYHWSSTTSASSSYSSSAWCVQFRSGGALLFPHYKSYSYHVRAVRGVESPPPQSFANNNNGTVTDNITGLMWQQDGSTQRNWSDALSYCDSSILDDYDDWRLPDMNELQSLVDYGRYNPSIDPIFDAELFRYWTSTTDINDPPYAWYVNFDYGEVSLELKSTNKYVRCVRGSGIDSDLDGIFNDGDISGTPGDNPCTGGQTQNCDDNCLNDPNPLQEDEDEDGIGNVCDNCPGVTNQNQANSDYDTLGNACDNCWYVSNPDQLDTNGSCSAPPYSSDPQCGDACESACELCSNYYTKYQACVALATSGKNLDISECKNYNTQSACEAAECYWRADKGRCVIDICLGDTDMSGKVVGSDRADINREYARNDCGAYEGDLCNKYQAKYGACEALCSAGSNLDISECKNYDTQGACEDANCHWYADKSRCVIDICLGDTDMSGKVVGADKADVNRDYGRSGCP